MEVVIDVIVESSEHEPDDADVLGGVPEYQGRNG
jgi:hypothetical protein